MEQYLLRNHETRKYLQEQAYRLQQGIVTTTTQQAGPAADTHSPDWETSPLFIQTERFFNLSHLYDADGGHDVCAGAGSPELPAVLGDHLCAGGHERRRKLHEGC